MLSTKKQLDCAILDIDAPAEWVWQTLTDTEHYERWSHSLRVKEGAFAVGETPVVCSTKLPMAQPSYKLHIEACESPHLLAWTLNIPVRQTLQLKRSHFVTALSESRCQYSSIIVFSGLAALFITPLLHRSLQRHLDDFATGLKAEAETRYFHHLQTVSSA
ncbi:Uncharacterised protein [BD1-7 clade bacterium]|uniref:SRPBCC domain-containing protein n=1 Tax=BD1-7 clade bacterium TaxID=2029982 RepID=A0A5S9QSA3_9GAMM|nr:Uncharacterised protein [BD1-7 clade bacterium]